MAPRRKGKEISTEKSMKIDFLLNPLNPLNESDLQEPMDSLEVEPDPQSDSKRGPRGESKTKSKKRPTGSCVYPGCPVVQANFNYPGHYPGIFCLKHKDPEMVNIRARTCQVEGCSTYPSFNYPNTCPPLYCARHKLAGMIILGKKFCQVPNCMAVPSFNYPKIRPPLYCSHHKSDGMVNVIKRFCQAENCPIHPCFNYPKNRTPIYCNQHKEEGMVNVVKQACQAENCQKKPLFNYPHQGPAICCTQHKLEGMVNLNRRACQAPGCYQQPHFNYLNESKGIFCADHRSSEMADVRYYQPCQHKDCHQRADYADPIRFRTLVCDQHKKRTMIRLSAQRCSQRGCLMTPIYGLPKKPGQKQHFYCFRHRKTGSIKFSGKSVGSKSQTR